MQFKIEYILFLIIFIPAISAFIGLLIGKKGEEIRNKFYFVVTLIVFALICFLYPYVKASPLYFNFSGIMGTGLFLKLDLLRYIFVFLTSFLWFLAYIFSTRYLLKYKNRNRYYMFFILTLANTLGVFMSDHILNLFTFFELMTVSSYFLVIHDEDEYTHRAGNMYIAMSIAGGLIQLMGIFLLYNYASTLLLSELPQAIVNMGDLKYSIAILIIIGFAVKACMFPLHIWLPKVYPPTPSPATAVFSAVLTKTGLFGILITLEMMKFDMYLSIFIAVAGLFNMFLGGFLAIHHRNIKKIFAYSSMSQIGYILLGLGFIGLIPEHGKDVAYSSVFHMVNHALTKGLLFFAVGIIFMTIQKLSLNEIRGFGKNSLILKLVFAVGFLGTIGVPGFSGFASKSMLHHAIAEAYSMYPPVWMMSVEVIFVISSAFTTAYLIKIYVALFHEDYPGVDEKDKHLDTPHTVFPLVILSIIIPLVGIKPDFFLHLMGYSAHVHFYTVKNAFNALISIAGGLVIYIIYINRFLKTKDHQGQPLLLNPTYEWFDLETHLYAPVLSFIFKYTTLLLHVLDNALVFLATKSSAFMRYLFSIEFYSDVSYYNRLANLYFKMKYRKHTKHTKPLSDSQFVMKYQKYFQNKKLESQLLSFKKLDSIKKYSPHEHMTEYAEKTNIKSNISDLCIKLSSITYSIIIFALILAALLIVMLAI
ncbi:MAG: hypothetical protein MJA31_10960 [Clostridia bacterium]|nr:hypothetical protein [Clostridia bacterium]